MEKYPELVQAKVTASQFRQLQAAAKREYVTVSQFVRKLIREALEKK